MDSIASGRDPITTLNSLLGNGNQGQTTRRLGKCLEGIVQSIPFRRRWDAGVVPETATTASRPRRRAFVDVLITTGILSDVLASSCARDERKQLFFLPHDSRSDWSYAVAEVSINGAVGGGGFGKEKE